MATARCNQQHENSEGDDASSLPITFEEACGQPLSVLPSKIRRRVVLKVLSDNPEWLADPSIRAIAFNAHQGPLPAPDDFFRYDEILPGDEESIA